MGRQPTTLKAFIHKCFSAFFHFFGKREKFLLMDKAVVILLICSFRDGQATIAHRLYVLSYYIIAVTGCGCFERIEYLLYLSDDEYCRLIQSLIHLKNSLIAQGRYTDAVDDILCKMISAKEIKVKIKYI